MKKLIISIAAVALLAAYVYAASALYPTAGAAAVASTTCTNNSALVKLSNGGHGILGVELVCVTADNTSTVGVSFVSGTTLANSPIIMTNGMKVLFPSTTYPFVPGGGIYVIGNSASILATTRCTVVRE